MESVDDDITSSTHFVPRRRPHPPSQNSSSATNNRRSAGRPHSIGALIISNPKLVKGWQYYDNSPYQKDIQKYFSTVNLGSDEGTSGGEVTKFLEQTTNSRAGGTTGTATSRSGGSGGSSDRNSSNHNEQSLLRGAGGNGDVEEGVGVTTDLVTGTEIKACVAQEEEQSCSDGFARIWGPILGIFLTLVASTALALSSVLQESLPPNQYHSYMVLVWTSQGLFWPSFVLLLCPCQMRSVTLTKEHIPPSFSNNKFVTIILIFLRAVFGWGSAILTLESLQYTSQDISTMVIISTSPVFVLLIAWILLKENPGCVPGIIAIAVILGVGVMLQPEVEFNKRLLLGGSFALGAMISEGVFSVLILRHIRHVHFALVTFIYGLVGMVGGLFLYYLDNEKFKLPLCGEDTLLGVIICVLVFLGQVGVCGALKYEKAGIFAVVSSWKAPMLVVGQVWFLGRSFDWLSLVGAIIILLGVVVLAIRNEVESRPRSRRTRKWLGFLIF